MIDPTANGSPLVFGVVSNVWGALLPHSSLRDQCRLAVARGYGHLELRQRALGECEEPGKPVPLPIPEQLAELTVAVPELQFNLAVEAPFLTETLDPRSAYLQRCLEAAWLLGSEPRVLRLVDVSPAPRLLDDAEIEVLGHSVASFAQEAWKSRIALALENSKQPVGVLRAVIRSAAAALPDGVPTPRLCWDPHNQFIQKLQPEDPLQTAQTVPVPEFWEFHFKQGREGVLQGEVGPGDLDWHGIVAGMVTRGFRGPALHEIPPGPDIWQRLDRSTAYVRTLIPTAGTEA